MRNFSRRLTCLRALSVLGLIASGQILQAAPSARWLSGPDLPTNLVRATGVYFPANGRFYTMGGRTSDAAGAEITRPYEYDPNTNTWVVKAALFPDKEVNNMACGVLTAEGTPYIYCVGGSAAGSTATTRRVFRYDPVADAIQTEGIDQWSENVLDTLPGGFAVVQNKLYILGGYIACATVTNRIFEFTPGNAVGAQWAQKGATLPLPLGFVPATAIGNLIFMAGGTTFAPGALTATTNSYVYNPARDTISLIPSIPRATGETRAVTVSNEMWVLGGGRTPNPSAEVNIYNPGSGKWRVGASLKTGQRNFPVASDGVRVFLGGGYDSSALPLKTVQIFGDISEAQPGN